MSYNHYIDYHHKRLEEETKKWDSNPPQTAIQKYEVGYYHYELFDYREAMKWFEEAIKEDITDSYYMLAYCINKTSEGSSKAEKSKTLFKEFFKRVREKSEITGREKYHLGMCYRYGYGIDKDILKALNLFEEAAKYEGKASFEIGKIYKEGSLEGKIDFDLAAQWFLKSYEQFNGQALFAHFEVSKNEIENYPYALELKTGYSYLLGMLMRVVKVNPGKDSYTRLARLYEKGYPGDTDEGNQKSLKQAQRYYKLAETMK